MRKEACSRDVNHLLRVVWEGVKKAEGGVASPLCDTPTEKDDEGDRTSCRVPCVCTRPHCVGVDCEFT